MKTIKQLLEARKRSYSFQDALGHSDSEDFHNKWGYHADSAKTLKMDGHSAENIRTRYHLVHDFPLEHASYDEGSGPDEDKIEQYTHTHGDAFPPVVLDKGGWAIEGRHRIAAAKLRGDKTIRAFVPHSLAKKVNRRK